MPTTSNNSSSPVKRPGLGRRAVSSHAVVTRSGSSSDKGDLSNSQTSHATQKAPGHRPYRAHIVGGGHRTHGRNPSFGKNLTKLQRHVSSQHIGAELRLHQRKKSAPVTPAASPPRNHVRWDGTLEEEGGSRHHTTASMKKNYSSPALRRNTSSTLPKKALVTDRPHTGSGKKKTVGFELADSDDDGEWEDTTQSPESTRRSSVAQSRDEDTPLVDPLTFVKRPYPQFPRATSLPESTSRSFHEENSSEQADGDHDQQPREAAETEQHPKEETLRPPDHHDIATRLLSPSKTAKAPPAMSSISATATPAAVDTISRNASLTNLASGHDGMRRPLPSANVTQASTPGTQAHATSSSIEGGVSRFIVDSKTGTYRTDSDPNTPSSFLPHYHPQTPPSPKGGANSSRTRASPPSRPPGTEPLSRTQQKLWLQRTAALNTSPPDSRGASGSASPSAMDPAFMGGTARVGPFDAARGLVNGGTRNGGALHQNEAKHIRKAYEKTAMELAVVRRFQSPTGDSFNRLDAVIKDVKTSSSSQEPRSGLGQPVKSAPALVLLQREGSRRSGRGNSGSHESRQLMGRHHSDLQSAVSREYVQDPEDPPHPSHRLLSTSDEAAHGGHGVEEDGAAEGSFSLSETDMMIRRMWESREVATSG